MGTVRTLKIKSLPTLPLSLSGRLRGKTTKKSMKKIKLEDEFEFAATEAQENAEYIKEVEIEFLQAFCLGNIKQA